MPLYTVILTCYTGGHEHITKFRCFFGDHQFIGYIASLRQCIHVTIEHSVVALTVDSQGCMDNAGSLNHNNLRVVPDRTFIFSDSGYTVVCEGTVIAWEFCYKEENKTSMTFYPGIWMPPKANNSSTNEYTLVKSSTITFTPTRVDNDDDNDKISCQTYNLTEADQFIAPAGSIVGLYSNMRGMQPSLLRTNSMAQLLTTYQFLGNRSNVSISISNNISYNIALRVHLGEYDEICAS